MRQLNDYSLELSVISISRLMFHNIQVLFDTHQLDFKEKGEWKGGCHRLRFCRLMHGFRSNVLHIIKQNKFIATIFVYIFL